MLKKHHVFSPVLPNLVNTDNTTVPFEAHELLPRSEVKSSNVEFQEMIRGLMRL